MTEAAVAAIKAFTEDQVKLKILELVKTVKPHAMVLMWISEDGECEQLIGGCEHCVKTMLEEDWDNSAEHIKDMIH